MLHPVFDSLVVVLSCGILATARAEGPHPIFPFVERLVAEGADAQALAGELLLGELACAACHTPERPITERTTPRRAPRLHDVGLRLRPQWVRRFLMDPQSAKPGTTMPAPLPGDDEKAKARVVDDLVHYLAGRRRRGRQTRKGVVGDPQRGRVLYHEVGCVACHDPAATYEPDPQGADVERPKVSLPSVSLGGPWSKYLDGELARFLRDPLDARPSGRMPRMELDTREAADIAGYLRSRHPPRPEEAFTVDTAKASRGLAAYQRLGCVRCHGDGDQRTTARRASGLPSFEALVTHVDKGCLAETPGPGSPNYSLDDRQRQALRAALRDLSLHSSASSPRDRVTRMMARFNCHACHVRGGRGGPEPGRDRYFRPAVEADLGEEGRLAPRLDEIGRKLKPAWLRRVLAGEGAMRPYLATRMPDFGIDNVERLVGDLAAADMRRGDKPYEVIGRNRYGRRLVGMDGLRCVECHHLAGHSSLGVPAIDLADVGERLQPRWFREYLLDPASKSPGTRMPAMWPGGESLFRTILGGNTSQQLDAIYVYLSEARQTRLPVGMEKKGAFELVPMTRPILLRTFMKDVGARAIAVGYPAGVHAAFDAGRARMALLWRGRFLDAEGTWDDRFAPFETPLAAAVRALPPGSALARLATGRTAWPQDSIGEYDGYRLEKNGAPVFLWRAVDGAVSIEERIVPGAAKGSFLRRLDLRGNESSVFLRVAVAVSEIREREAGGEYVVDGDLRVAVLGDAAKRAFVRRAGDGSDLVVPVRFEDGKARVEVELSW